MKEKKSFHIGIGITSMLMIFVVLCLTTFGILSYTSANAEYKLTENNSNYVKSYYDGYSTCAKAIARLDAIIYNTRKTEKNNTEEYYDAIEKEIDNISVENCSFDLMRNEDEFLLNIISNIANEQQFILEVKINKENDSARYNVLSCYVKSKNGNFSYEEELPDMWGE